MAVAVGRLTASGSPNDSIAYTTASVSVAAGDVLLLTVYSEGSSLRPTSVSGLGATWTRVTAVNAASTYGLDVFAGVVSVATTGAATITYSAAAAGCFWLLDKATGVDTSALLSTGIVQHASATNGTTQTNLVAPTFSAALTAGNATWSVVGWSTSSTTVAPATVGGTAQTRIGANFIGANFIGTDAGQSYQLGSAWLVGGTTLVGWKHGSLTRYGKVIAVELKAATAAPVGSVLRTQAGPVTVRFKG